MAIMLTICESFDKFLCAKFEITYIIDALLSKV